MAIPDMTSAVSLLVILDWVRVTFLGQFIIFFTQRLQDLWAKFTNLFWITAEFHEDDDTYTWLMHWLSKQEAYYRHREISVSTDRDAFETNVEETTPIDHPADAIKSNSHTKVKYVLARHATCSLWFNRHWVRVTRGQIDGTYEYRKKESIVTVRHVLENVSIVPTC
jgi:chaperone BCS1